MDFAYVRKVFVESRHDYSFDLGVQKVDFAYVHKVFVDDGHD